MQDPSVGERPSRANSARLLHAQLSPRTFWNFAREFSSFRRATVVEVTADEARAMETNLGPFAHTRDPEAGPWIAAAAAIAQGLGVNSGGQVMAIRMDDHMTPATIEKYPKYVLMSKAHLAEIGGQEPKSLGELGRVWPRPIGEVDRRSHPGRTLEWRRDGGTTRAIGSNKLSAELHVLKGTYRPGRHRPRTPAPVVTETITPQAWLTGPALELWHAHVSSYQQRGQNVLGCEALLALYCQLEVTIIEKWRTGQPMARVWFAGP